MKEQQAEIKNSAYWSLFRGNKVRMGLIEKETPYVKPVLNTLIREGSIIGQHVFDFNKQGDVTGDIILFIAKNNGKSSLK